MNDITANFLFAHALELRLLLALIIVPVTYATIQIALFVASTARSLLATVNSIGTRDVATAAYSAAGAR